MKHPQVFSRILIAATVSAAFTCASQAAEKPSAAGSAAAAVSVPPPVASAVQRVSNGQAKIEHVFDAPMGLVGLAVNLGAGRNMILYSSKDGRYMIMGGIFGPNGENYTADAAKKYLPPPPAAPNAAANFAAIKDTTNFLWGKASAPKEVWMVTDPDCIFCHKMFAGFEPFVKKGELKVHVIMVGFLKPDSLGKAAAILSAKDPASALTMDEAQFNASVEEGGIKPDMSNAKAVESVKSNNKWMSSHGIGGTPYILYRDKSGNPAVLPGFAADAKGFLDNVESR
jgi:thiol:disulfide interchange protein DsbG